MHGATIKKKPHGVVFPVPNFAFAKYIGDIILEKLLISNLLMKFHASVELEGP